MQPAPFRHPEPFGHPVSFMLQNLREHFFLRVSCEPIDRPRGMLRSCTRSMLRSCKPAQGCWQIRWVPVLKAAPTRGRQHIQMRGCGAGAPLQKQLRAPGLMIPIQHGSGAHLIALLGLLDLPVLGRVLPKSRFKFCGKQCSGQATLACKPMCSTVVGPRSLGLDGCSTSGCPNYKFCL